MCGIIGVIASKNPNIQPPQIRDAVDQLLLLSESRGKDASGVAVLRPNQLLVYKQPLPSSRFVRTQEYHTLLEKSLQFMQGNLHTPYPLMLIGHARMETNGSLGISHNNQPVVSHGMATIHNGIISNDGQLWQAHPKLRRNFEVDTEVFNALLRQELMNGRSLADATRTVFRQIEGTASIATFFDDREQLLVATNTGSLYMANYSQGGFFCFASERYFLEQLFRRKHTNWPIIKIRQLPPQNGIVIDGPGLRLQLFSLRGNDHIKETPATGHKKSIVFLTPETGHRRPLTTNAARRELTGTIQGMYEQVQPRIDRLRRCTRCILPETMPFIKFDQKGVCTYCHNYVSRRLLSTSELERAISPFRRQDGLPDCIIPFSGGRDSSYGLHYAKTVLKMNPVAYSYDWGMLTDLGRRNQARMCGALGVEHILISADIQKKRANIKKNVLAWLRRPHLGTIPLFMAGDKHYFYYANKLQQQQNIQLIVYSENSLEKTDFKSGFCGIKPQFNIHHGYNLGWYNKVKMATFYGREFLHNPSLINSTMVDSLTAFSASYFIPHDYLFLFQYVLWDENIVAKTLIETYHWEVAEDTKTTWRIGDGTAPFYNYIYYTVAGFSEIDTFRSNQIREGQMSRDEALAKSREENQPRIESILWYGGTIDIDIAKAIQRINTMPKLF